MSRSGIDIEQMPIAVKKKTIAADAIRYQRESHSSSYAESQSRMLRGSEDHCWHQVVVPLSVKEMHWPVFGS